MGKGLCPPRCFFAGTPLVLYRHHTGEKRTGAGEGVRLSADDLDANPAGDSIGVGPVFAVGILWHIDKRSDLYGGHV